MKYDMMKALQLFSIMAGHSDQVDCILTTQADAARRPAHQWRIIQDHCVHQLSPLRLYSDQSLSSHKLQLIGCYKIIKAGDMV